MKRNVSLKDETRVKVQECKGERYICLIAQEFSHSQAHLEFSKYRNGEDSSPL